MGQKKATMANWKSSFRLTFYTFVMEIFWTDAGTGAVKVRVAFCQFSLRVAFPKLSFIIEHNFEKLCHKSTILQSLKIDSDNSVQCFSDTFAGFNKCSISSNLLDPTVFPRFTTLQA